MVVQSKAIFTAMFSTSCTSGSVSLLLQIDYRWLFESNKSRNPSYIANTQCLNLLMMDVALWSFLEDAYILRGVSLTDPLLPSLGHLHHNHWSVKWIELQQVHFGAVPDHSSIIPGYRLDGPADFFTAPGITPLVCFPPVAVRNNYSSAPDCSADIGAII